VSGSPRDKQRLLIHEKIKDTTLILQRQMTLPFSTRKRTVHVVDRIVVPGSPPTNRSVPRVLLPITARRWTLRIPTRPLQTPVCELHVIFLVLAGDRQRVGKLGVEPVRIGDVDGLAKGEGIADGCMINVGLVVVDELDDGEEILVVAGTGLHLGQVEGACAGGISGRRRRRRRSSAFGVGMGIVSV